MRLRPAQPGFRWLVIGMMDEMGRHYEGEATTRREAERLAAGWSGVIVDRRPRPRWSLREAAVPGDSSPQSPLKQAGIRRSRRPHERDTAS